VIVDRTQAQIKEAPDYDESKATDVSYRGQLGDYYGEQGAGWGK
jgi:hypothetical protein